MKNVMQKAQELADAVAASDVYRKMKELEKAVEEDPDAAEAVNALMRKRQRVEDLLTEKGMDPGELKRASAEMADAERKMNANGKVAALKASRKEFAEMMNNGNRSRRVVITGEIREDDIDIGCSGDCGSCGGCG